MATLDRDGFAIAYEVTGPADGPAILFTHGFSATGRMWSTTTAVLADRHRCITWDLRGHGASDAPDDPDRYSPELALGDMEGLLDASGADRAILVGHSLGGYLSLRFHRRAPGRVAALVLVDTGPGYRNEAARAGWNDLCEDFAVGFETDGLDRLTAGSPEVAAATHRSATGLVHAARRILTQHDAAVVDHLPDIDVPTLVVVGSEDRPFLAGSDYLAAKIPGAALVVVDGAGHAPMLTHPELFQGALASFLARSRVSRASTGGSTRRPS